MANTKSAQRQIVKNEKRRKVNHARKSAIKTCYKKVIAALDAGKNKEEVMVIFNEVQAKCARAKNKGLFHARTASRAAEPDAPP